MNLKSSVQDKGKIVTQIIHFVHGEKKTFPGVKTESIVQGQFTHFDTEDGRRVMVNDKNVLFVEVFEENLAGTLTIKEMSRLYKRAKKYEANI